MITSIRIRYSWTALLQGGVDLVEFGLVCVLNSLTPNVAFSCSARKGSRRHYNNQIRVRDLFMKVAPGVKLASFCG